MNIAKSSKKAVRWFSTFTDAKTTFAQLMKLSTFGKPVSINIKPSKK